MSTKPEPTGRADEQTATWADVPWLEWLASGIGLVLALCLFGSLGWQAFRGASSPPIVTVAIMNIAAVEAGYRVEFRAANSGGGTASQVEIEGKVSASGGEEEVAHVVLDYIPGHSDREGGFFFKQDPRANVLTVRALGFARP